MNYAGLSAMSDAAVLSLVWGKSEREAHAALEENGGVAGLVFGHMPTDRVSRLYEKVQAARELIARAMQSGLIDQREEQTSQTIQAMLIAKTGALPYEAFHCVYLDVRGKVLRITQLFRGTLTQASIYPRDIVIEALAVGATTVIVSHNHPLGTAQPSRADEHLTQVVKQALALVDVRLLDHIIVAANTSLSMAERGLI